MRTNELIREIQQLSIAKRIYVVEKTIHSIRKHEDSDQMKKAADALLSDYISDNELTVFTNLDFESFYEAR
jgi:tRNA(Ser,Leu) C12 N-acetylase TAN1